MIGGVGHVAHLVQRVVCHRTGANWHGLDREVARVLRQAVRASSAVACLTRLSDPYATAAILWSRVSMTSGEGASVPEGPKTSYCHICNRNVPNMSVNVGVTL